MKVTFDIAKQLFSYDPITGELSPKDSAYRARISQGGYIRIALKGTQFLAHRIAWLLMTGAFPENGMEIDHKNGDKADNRWCNLQKVFRTDNQRNQFKASRNSKTNLRGVSFIPTLNKFRVRVFANGKQHNIGYFFSEVEAVAAREAAVRKFHFSGE